MPRGEARQRSVGTAAQRGALHSRASSRRNVTAAAAAATADPIDLMVEPLTIGACTECFGTNLNLAASPPAAYTTLN